MRAKDFIPAGKPRNFVAKNAPTTGAGKHKDSSKKKDQEQGKVKHKNKQMDMAEGAPIVVAQAPIHIRNPKKAPQPYRNQGDIVPDTKPPSTEKRGVKGRPGQRPMPEQGVAEGEADYGPDYQDKVKRLGQMAKQGERKTVWDPVKRVYKTVPVNSAPEKK